MSGNHVSADVGGNLTIQSVQDTTVSAAHQSSTSGGFSISQAGGSASFSAQHGSANGDYAAVNEQAGIQAGSGGFDINVKGNTNLTGAYIGSDADASKNSLTTGTLTVSDIQDHSEYSASSSGFSAGGGIGSTGKATGPGSVSGSGGVTPMLSQSDSGSSSATTKSGIAAGTINITDAANQTQDVASINRDTTDLNGSVSKLPDVNNLLSQQADMMNAAQAAGQTVAQAIGDYASKKQKEAQASADAAAKAGDPEAAAQYKAEADSWAEGGTNRALLHAAGGALIAGLGGGNALGGAAGAGASAVLAGKLNSIADAIGGETGSMLAGNVVSNVLAGAGGALLGGNSGAVGAANADLYNRSTTNGEGQGGTGSQFLDSISSAVNQYLEIRQALGDALASAGSQFVGKMNSDAQTKMSEPASNLIAQGIANGVTAITGLSGGEPPTASAGSVAANSSGAAQVVDAAPGVGMSGTATGAPPNAIFSDGSKGDGASPSSEGTTTSSDFVLTDNRATKIFGSRDGHIADTPENRALLTSVANNPTTTLGPDKYGTIWSAQIQSDGSQVWVQTRNGQVWNGGINKTPLPYNPETGLAAPTKPGWK